MTTAAQMGSLQPRLEREEGHLQNSAGTEVFEHTEENFTSLLESRWGELVMGI